MDDLIAFVTARLAEDEAAAKLAARGGGAWKQDDPERYPGAISSPAYRVVYDEGAPDEHQAAHIVRHDPARVLRDVAADRKLIAAYEDVGEFSDPWIGLDLAVRIRAERFSDHPDYRQEWAP